MPKKLARKGASWHFEIFDILSGKQIVNGALRIIDVSRLSIFWSAPFAAGFLE